MTASPSFHELFDENGHIRNQSLSITTNEESCHRTNSKSNATASTVTGIAMDNETNGNSAAHHAAAPQSQASLFLQSNFNPADRPQSSYSKTRSAIDSSTNNRGTAQLQLNLSPAGSVPSMEDFQRHKHINTRSPITMEQQSQHHQLTRSSLFYHDAALSSPPPPPAPQATIDIIDEQDDFISHLSLQPSIHSSISQSFIPSLRPLPKQHISPQQQNNNNQEQDQDQNIYPLLFSSVPLDALHCIAGFLTVEDWYNVGLVSKEALVACREVFKKVKMHGFKCAVEIISAWVCFFSMLSNICFMIFNYIDRFLHCRILLIFPLVM